MRDRPTETYNTHTHSYDKEEKKNRWLRRYFVVTNARCLSAQTIEIDHTMDVLMHMQFYQLAIAQRWKRTCWSANKLMNKLQSRCLRVEVSRCPCRLQSHRHARHDNTVLSVSRPLPVALIPGARGAIAPPPIKIYLGESIFSPPQSFS